MELEKIEKMVNEDVRIDKTDLATEALRVPFLHNKYLKIQNSEVLLLKQFLFKLDTLTRNRIDFYTGKAEPEVYKEEPWDITVLKNEVDTYLRADAKLQALKAKIVIQEQKIEYLKSVIIQLSNRNWAIKNAIDFIKYQNGQ